MGCAGWVRLFIFVGDPEILTEALQYLFPISTISPSTNQVYGRKTGRTICDIRNTSYEMKSSLPQRIMRIDSDHSSRHIAEKNGSESLSAED